MDQETKREFETLTGVIKESFELVDRRFDSIEEKVENLQQDVSWIKTELRSVDEKLNNLESQLTLLQKSAKEDIDIFAKDIIELRRRVEMLEKQVRQFSPS